MLHPRRIASAILDVFKSQQARVGYVVPSNVIVALSDREGWSVDQVEDGLAYAFNGGWFRNGPRTFVSLTDAGFIEMKKAPSPLN
jgi:hypothetical protein